MMQASFLLLYCLTHYGAIAELFHYGFSFGVAVLMALAAAALLEATRRSAPRRPSRAQSGGQQFNDREAQA
ncbi:MAG TPA: hypothetical protein VJW93_06380 [Candidatus Acidoferrales bacterium]|nr:hypothetical protein [Candidatus Acidoferrales bacterium]